MKQPRNILRCLAATTLSLTLAASLGGCAGVSATSASNTSSANEASTTSANTSASTSAVDDLSLYDLEYTSRDLDGTYDATSAVTIALADNATSAKTAAGETAEGVSISGNDLTITAAGTYVLSGTLTDGCVFVNISKEEKCQLVLNGVTITNNDGPCIYVMSADKTFITLAEGSENTLTDGANYVLDEDDEPTATIFSKDDLTINGTGSLSVTGNYRHAIRSKDDVVITGGTYVITAVENAISGKDCVKICEGTFDITCGEDAVKSTNDSEEGRGFVAIDGGNFTISAGDDAFHAETLFRITNGTVNVETCYEGYEGIVVRIDGGTTNITATDDALNAASGTSTEGADAPGQPGNADTAGAAAGGNADTSGAAPTGEPAAGAAGSGAQGGSAQGEAPSAPSGSAGAGDPGAAGDAAGAAGGAAGGAGDPGAAGDAAGAAGAGGMGADAGAGATAADSNCKIIVTGGTTYVSAQGDGIDSNGSVEITGGVLVVEGPTSSDDGFFDYDGSATITGGTVLMVGSAGMAQNFSGGTQAFAMQSISGNAGQTVTLLNAQGTEVASFVATKSFQVVLASAAGTEEGETLVVKVDDIENELTASTAATNGSMGTMTPQANGADGGQGGAGGGQPGGTQGAPSGQVSV